MRAVRSEPWTDHDDAVLRAGVEEGRTDQQIGALLDRTAMAVRKRRHRLGLLLRAAPAGPVDHAALVAAHAEGLTTRAIAERLGITHRTAQEHLARAGLRAHLGRRAPGAGRPPARRVELLELLSAGALTVPEIAERMGVALGTARELVRRAAGSGYVQRIGDLVDRP